MYLYNKGINWLLTHNHYMFLKTNPIKNVCLAMILMVNTYIQTDCFYKKNKVFFINNILQKAFVTESFFITKKGGLNE